MFSNWKCILRGHLLLLKKGQIIMPFTALGSFKIKSINHKCVKRHFSGQKNRTEKTKFNSHIRVCAILI